MSFHDKLADMFEFVGGSQLTFRVKAPYIFAGGASGASGTGPVIPGEQFAYQSVAFSLGNVATAVPLFSAAHDTFTVAAATTYMFQLNARLTTGATTHTTAFGLLGAGVGTTFTSVNLEAFISSAADAGVAASTQSSITVATAQVLNATSTAVKTNILIIGSFQTLLGGTIIPSVTFSADPTGTNQTDIGSYCKIYAIGSNAFAGTSGWS